MSTEPSTSSDSPVESPLHERNEIDDHRAKDYQGEERRVGFGETTRQLCEEARLKGVGHIDQQTFFDTNRAVGVAKLYARKTPVMTAELLNDRVLHFFEQQKTPLNRILPDRGTKYCGAPERHE